MARNTGVAVEDLEIQSGRGIPADVYKRQQLTVAGTREKIVMIEAGANQVKEDTMLEAIAKAHEEIKKIAQFIADVQAEIGKSKFSFESQEVDHDMFEAIKDFAIDKVKYALDTDCLLYTSRCV